MLQWSVSAATGLLTPGLALSTWPVALCLRLSHSTLTGLLPFRRIRNGVVVIVVIRALSSCFDCFLWRIGGNEAVATVSDEIRSPRFFQRLPNLEPVLRLKELHQRPLHLPVAQPFGDVDRFLSKRIDAGV